MTVRDDRLPTRQEVEKRCEMRSDAQKPHTFKLLTWNHNSEDVHFPYAREEKVPLSSVVPTRAPTLDVSKECRLLARRVHALSDAWRERCLSSRERCTGFIQEDSI